MIPAGIHMTDDAALKLYRLAEQFFGRPENTELSKKLFEQDKLEKERRAG